LISKKIKPVKLQQPLPIIVRDKIVELIQQDKVFPPGSQLPNEAELAEILGVGRGTLREALRLLEQQGLIIRRPGIGTIVRKEHLLVRNPLETNFSVTELIKSTNSTPGIQEVKIKIIKSDSIISDKLEVEIGSPMVFKEAVRTANGRPVVYTINIFPTSILMKKERTYRELDQYLEELCKAEEYWESLYEALEKEYGCSVDYGIAKIIPTVATPELSKKLNVNIGSPMLLIEQVNYDVNDRALMYNQHYWIEGVVEFTIFRKRKK